VAVVLINIPLVVIGTRGFPVLSLFLIGNLLTSCGILPLMFGLIRPWRHFFTETSFVFGVFGGVLAVTASGIAYSWVPGDLATSFSKGADWAWYSNNYDWRPFLAALVGSAFVSIAWSTSALLFKKATGKSGPGISGVLMKVPGMRAITASPNWSPDKALPAWEVPVKPLQKPVDAAGAQQAA
jgi:hypothetical protein